MLEIVREIGEKGQVSNRSLSLGAVRLLQPAN
jgi:hypothetical protein